MSSRNRIRCPKCNKKLSYSAYKRHKNPLFCPPGASSEETSQSTLMDHGGPDDGSDYFQTEGQDISDGQNYDQSEINGESEDEEVIQKISDELSGSVSSDKESDLENHEQENEAQVGDNIDVIDQELCVQPTDRMPDDISCYESASGSLSNSANALSTLTNQNVHTAGGKAPVSLSSLVLQPLAIDLFFFQLVYKVSHRDIEFVLKVFETLLKIISQCLDDNRIQLLLNQLPKTVYQLRKKQNVYRVKQVCCMSQMLSMIQDPK